MPSSAVRDHPRASIPVPGRPVQPALAGVASALLALAVSELLAGLVSSVPSLVYAVGAVVVDNVPPSVKDAAIAVFGTADKPALLVGIVALSAAAGAALGQVAARRFALGAAGFAAFGVAGAVAALGDPQASPALGVASAFASVAVGIRALRYLLDAAATGSPREGRRRLLVVGALALGAAATGRWLLRGRVATLAARAGMVLPPARRPLPDPPASASLPVEGLSPLVTPNADFYRIDTALSVPMVDPASWRLRLDGMVDRPRSFSYDDLLAMDLMEADVTLCCVSNDVGGGLIGNARWLGVPLARLLDDAGVQPGADQIVGHSVDGWTGGFPTSVGRDGRATLIAVGMNGEPLPIVHGFPARLVVPGLYGYVSATKWLSRIQLTTWEGFDGYWVPRGWSKEGPVKTQSRIDVPAPDAVIPVGRTAIAGVAWAQHRGISRVEVQVDDSPWREARLAGELHVDTWRQWVVDWNATPGAHRIRVRAADGTGEVQTAVVAPPAPDGATGYHTIGVRVR